MPSNCDSTDKLQTHNMTNNENESTFCKNTTVKKELTIEELEAIKEKRKERRKREKENKKKLKEQQKRAEYYAPKSSKINVVSADILKKRYF